MKNRAFHFPLLFVGFRQGLAAGHRRRHEVKIRNHFITAVVCKKWPLTKRNFYGPTDSRGALRTPLADKMAGLKKKTSFTINISATF